MESNSRIGPLPTKSCSALEKRIQCLQELQNVSGGNVAKNTGSPSRYRENKSNNSGWQIVSEDVVMSSPNDLNERFLTVLDHLDVHVEKLRKDAMLLQEKRDYLLMSIDLIKSNDLLLAMPESERDEIYTYVQRVNARLGTVDLAVRTVRDTSQEDSLSQVNHLIDAMITMGDPVFSRQRCQQYLNACCSSMETDEGLGRRFSKEFNLMEEEHNTVYEIDLGPVDKKFESALLGCTLDDQKNVKKRLQALLDYLNKRIVTYSDLETNNTSKPVLNSKPSDHNKFSRNSKNFKDVV